MDIVCVVPVFELGTCAFDGFSGGLAVIIFLDNLRFWVCVWAGVEIVH